MAKPHCCDEEPFGDLKKFRFSVAVRGKHPPSAFIVRKIHELIKGARMLFML
jgi:hypothetical protein